MSKPPIPYKTYIQPQQILDSECPVTIEIEKDNLKPGDILISIKNLTIDTNKSGFNNEFHVPIHTKFMVKSIFNAQVCKGEDTMTCVIMAPINIHIDNDFKFNPPNKCGNCNKPYVFHHSIPRLMKDDRNVSFQMQPRFMNCFAVHNAEWRSAQKIIGLKVNDLEIAKHAIKINEKARSTV